MIVCQMELKEIGLDMRSLHPRLARAVSYGMNNAGRRVFTIVRRGLWKKIGATKYSTVTRRTYSIPASPNALNFVIVAKGKPIPIREFSPKRVAGGIQASPWGAARVFERSYQEKIAGGGYMPNGYFARIGEGHNPIRRLFGPNLAKELLGITRDDRTIPDLFIEAARAEVPPQILRALEATLSRQ